MAGMIRVLGEDGGDAVLDVIVILLGPYIAVKGEYIKGLSFDIIGEFLGKGLISFDARGFSFFGIRFLLVGGHGIDPEPFAITNLFAAFHGFFDQRLGLLCGLSVCLLPALWPRHVPRPRVVVDVDPARGAKLRYAGQAPELKIDFPKILEQAPNMGGARSAPSIARRLPVAAF